MQTTNRNKTGKRRFWKRRRFWIPVCLLLGSILLRNQIAICLIERLAPDLIGTKVSISELYLGWGTCQISGLQVDEPRRVGRELLKIPHVNIEFASLSEMRSGIYLHFVDIDSPELHIRFDRNGNLKSKFPAVPEMDDSVSTIPLKRLLVNNATLVIHQDHKPNLVFKADEIRATIGKEIKVELDVKELFGGTVTLQSTLDAETFEGETDISVTNVRLKSEQLSRLPLVPKLEQIQQFDGMGSLKLRAIHPANQLDIRRHAFSLFARIQKIETADRLLDEVVLQAECVNGILKVDGKANPLEGSATIAANSNLFANPLVVNIDASADHLAAHRLTNLVATLVDIPFSIPSFTVNSSNRLLARFTLQPTRVEFEASAFSKFDQLSFDTMSIEPLSVNVQANGSFDSRSKTPLSGSVNGSFDWSGIAVEEVSRRFDFGVASGKVHAQGQFSIPLEQWNNPAAFIATASLSSTGTSCQGVTIDDVKVITQLKLGKLSIELPPTNLNHVEGAESSKRIANVSGSLRADLDRNADGEVIIKANANDIMTTTLANVLGLDEQQFEGVFSAQGFLRAPIRDIANPSSWIGETLVDCKDLVIMNEAISDFEGFCFLENGNIVMPECALQWRNSICRVKASGNIDQSYQVQCGFAVEPILLTDVSQLARRFSNADLPIEGVAQIRGVLGWKFPNEISAHGHALLSNASYARSPIGNTELKWEFGNGAMHLENSSSDFLGGSYELVAGVDSLDWTQANVRCRFRNIQASRLVAFAKQPSLQAAGMFDGEFRFNTIESLASLSGNGLIRSHGVTLNGVKLELAKCHVAVEEGIASSDVKCSLANGTIDAIAHCSLVDAVEFVRASDQPLNQFPVFGELQLEQLSISQLVGVTPLKRPLMPLRGSVSLQCVRNQAELNDGLICRVVAQSENISWNHARLSQRVAADIEFSEREIRLRQLRGEVADGQLNGTAQIRLQNRPQGSFRFSLSNVNLRRASIPFLGSTNSVSGTGHFGLSGRIDRNVAGQLNVKLDNVKHSGVVVRQLRLPVDWSYLMDSKLARWQCRTGTVETGSGRVHIVSQGSYSRGLTTNSTFRLERIDTSKLMVNKSIGAGIVDGTIKLNAQRANELSDFTGNFDLKLSQTEALELPVLNQLPQMIKLPDLNSGFMANEGGIVKGRLSGGLVYLDEMSIVQSNIQVMMDGTASLDGKLNFDVTASTNDSGPLDDLLSLADSPLMSAGAAPVAMVARANQIIKNRVVHVNVTGTATRPALRLQPGKQLSQDALKFFIRTAAGSRIADLTVERNRRR